MVLQHTDVIRLTRHGRTTACCTYGKHIVHNGRVCIPTDDRLTSCYVTPWKALRTHSLIICLHMVLALAVVGECHKATVMEGLTGTAFLHKPLLAMCAVKHLCGGVVLDA